MRTVLKSNMETVIFEKVTSDIYYTWAEPSNAPKKEISKAEAVTLIRDLKKEGFEEEK